MADDVPAELPNPGSAFALRNWRVRTRLIALIAVPTIVAVLFGALRVTGSISSAEQYQRYSDVGALVSQLGELSRDLALERDMAARFVASGRRSQEGDQFRRQQLVVDASVKRVFPVATVAEPSLSELGKKTLTNTRTRLGQLASLRQTVTKSQLPPLPTMEKYSETIAEILQLFDELSNGSTDEQLIAASAAVRAVARTEEEASQQRGLLTIALVRGSFLETEFNAFLDARSRRFSERSAFRAVATPAQRQFYDNTVASQKIGRSELYASRAVLLHSTGVSLRRLDPATASDVNRWFDSMTETIDRLHAVQKSLSEQIATRSADIQGGEKQLAGLNIVIVAVLLLMVLAMTSIMARSLVRPLRRLRGDALKVASRTLPELVRNLRDGEVDAKSIRVPPIAVSSSDEIGEVARAFDEVHREAVRLAGEESRLRSNVNAMFVNLSRRSQTLVERQITLIDGLEQGEQDESRLANLFKLDHLATRMRRNSENLLVLAGQDPPRRWSQPVKLVDVARASLSEVENYERVVLQVPDGVSVAGQAVNDVIHLLAELVENALSFSPRETRVTVSGSRIDGGGVMLSVTDSGIGMTQDELVQANERLVDAPTVDVSVSRRMGLFVVARLAHRHGIRVQLRPHGGGGLTAMVLIPESLLGNQPPAYPGAGAAGGVREEAYASAAPVPTAPPMAQWPAGGYQPGPGHPSYSSGNYPSGPGDSGGAWPSVPSMPQWPSDVGGWPSEPRATSAGASQGAGMGAGYDTSDVWVPARNTGGSWPSDGTGGGLPKRPTADQPQSWNSGDHQPSWNSGEQQSTWSFADRGETSVAPRPRYDFPETEAAATGPMPAVKPASAGDEFLPIFASVESAWFDHGESGASWGSSKADAGWSAAEAVVEPVRDGATASGLPKRVPKANLVPGSADSASAPKAVAPMPAVSPDRVRSRLSSFQQGFRAARDDISEGKTYSSGTGPVDNREEGA
ncbi:nitrate- and nitrite sensing domain-containing protein [Nonomuraea sp. 3-1Str]|uniref:nitrate- and nitrite sensing domain-containing protein n=2 Tax=unclassified Nonomuraea TaxID=2593643 RepID=UPI002858132C|nr:nitrate- and nitrite sensing domain-containing protein [Nonomuraea sp. 3-1Str]MDR8410718.1 nitrate- and nitrite sensing domain-containing protein [Nonomuraea sp. 3-1Str]